MARINIREDGAYAGWFDDSKSEYWRDDDTGATLYRTPSERWVLHLWSGGSAYRFLTDDEAREWLFSRSIPLPRDEEPSHGGRPEIGNPVKVRLGGLLTSVDEVAARRHESRSDCIRHLIALGLQLETKEPAQ